MKQVSHNIAFSLEHTAQNYPNNKAVIVPHKNSSISFSQLNHESSLIASGLNQYGFKKGDRVLLLVPFSIKFFAIAFGLFKAGAVPVFIDPGLGKKKILKCIKEVEPQGIIATPIIHIISKVCRKYFSNIRHRVTVGKRWFWGGKTLGEIYNMAYGSRHRSINIFPNDSAAILFTSGSTGSPKGVLYTHKMFSHQLDSLRTCYQIQPGEIDLPTFPLFALFGVGTGMTSVLPDMDFTCPAKVDPKKIIKIIESYNVNSGFGSPALWDTISRYCISNSQQLPSIDRILMAGAPIPGSLLKRFDNIIKSESKIYTPYGATEALPVTTMERKEVLEDTFDKTQKGYGTCIGRVVPNIKLKIIAITDDPIPQWSDSLELLQGKIGEVIVKGPWVAEYYFNRSKETRLAKIRDNDNSFWHRMGDVGYFDTKNRLWFCGRKSQRVRTAYGTLFTVQCEAIFNSHPKVKRSALVGLGKTGSQKPVIIIEPENLNDLNNISSCKELTSDLLKLGSQNNHTFKIKNIILHPEFPVDIRHNAKIFREQLAQWAADKISNI